MEFGKPQEVVRDVVQAGLNIASFVGDRLIGGHWGELATKVKAANIQLHIGDNIERGEE